VGRPGIGQEQRGKSKAFLPFEIDRSLSKPPRLGGVIGAKAIYLAQFHVIFPTWEILCNGAGHLVRRGDRRPRRRYSFMPKQTKTSFVKLLDSLTPAGLIGLGIGRIGCWSAGCCPGEMLGIHTEPISAAFDIVLGLTLTSRLKNARREKHRSSAWPPIRCSDRR